MFNLQPLSIVIDEEGKVSGIQMRRTEMGAPDSQGQAAGGTR
ncbi:Glutamate synthase [NADPH] small chain [Serratia fonticola]|uniref:Glutamate synthase [NADPH] small chain n=1 Tax=Serratia fonticola TaxID=47917 RepID=A0A4U9VDE4_SERFO|nr:Glutamate synthase [NADPH] small chain [Serratia fonticola]